jgi:replicative DNA helicase Mcm
MDDAVEILRDHYLERIHDAENGVLEVDWSDFQEYFKTYQFPINDYIETILSTARSLSLKYFQTTNELTDIRFYNLPEIGIRDILSSDMMGTLIAVRGIVVRTAPRRPIITKAVWECRNCDTENIVEQTNDFLLKPVECIECGKTRAWELKTDKCTYEDFQDVRIQERPEDLPPGQVPRWIRVHITGGLIDVAQAGDIVTIVGLLCAKQGSSSSRLFDEYLKTNNIIIHNKDWTHVMISKDELAQIQRIAAHPACHEYFIHALAPSIYGHDHIKEAIMYLLFGGVQHESQDISIREEIHILLIGDPGTAKSQLLLTTAGVAPRALYAAGKGSSAAGLTAAVVKESDRWTLEVGALILADRRASSPSTRRASTRRSTHERPFSRHVIRSLGDTSRNSHSART